MDQKSMIDDLVAQLDAGMTNGVGHVNVDVDESMDVADAFLDAL